MFHLFSGKPTGETRPLVYKLMHCEKENGVGAKVLEPIKNASWNERERERRVVKLDIPMLWGSHPWHLGGFTSNQRQGDCWPS